MSDGYEGNEKSIHQFLIEESNKLFEAIINKGYIDVQQMQDNIVFLKLLKELVQYIPEEVLQQMIENIVSELTQNPEKFFYSNLDHELDDEEIEGIMNNEKLTKAGLTKEEIEMYWEMEEPEDTSQAKNIIYKIIYDHRGSV